MARTVAIVPHTHWDREWYSPFQTFRLRLVDLLDELLPRLEADPSYAHFLLDGQMAVVDDYLAVQPEAEDTMRRLAASGRLAMGPWYILMDEFLVSAETIVRDLQLGLERAAAFGGAMEVGYLPDMFGHVAQMPQILRQGGFEHAVVWRGVPEEIDRTGFWWEAPDGSTVRAEYLPLGYGNGASLPDDAKDLIRRVAAFEDEVGHMLLDGILWMNGTDHQVPQPWLGRVVAEANEIQDDYHLVVMPLADYVCRAPTEGLPRWKGELRSGARTPVLMGVASNRVDVKQAAARVERALEDRTEPLCALFLPAERWPEALLREAWLQVIRNAAHDSICACSVDDTVDAVLHRFNEARHIADGLAARALDMVAAVMAHEGPTLVNSTQRERAGVVELIVPGSGPIPGAQLLSERASDVWEMTVTGSDLAGLLTQIRSQQFDDTTYINAVDVEPGEDGVDITLHADYRLRDHVLVEEVKAEVAALASERPDQPFRIRMVQPPHRKVVARAGPVPAYGWARWEPAELDVEPVRAVGDHGLANGLVTVEVDPADGTFAVDGLTGFDRLVDDGDVGDTYNWSPPEHQTVVDAPEAVAVEVLESGPVRGRLRVRRTYRWPHRIVFSERARSGERVVEVTTTIELRAGEEVVRVTTALDNTCEDHRLRTWLPLPAPATASRAECAFAVVERGLEHEGGPTEKPLPTYPSRRFVQAGGLTVLHEGLLEYELVHPDGPAAEVGEATHLALTLLRATAMLSRVEMTMRPLPAGPPLPTRGSQVLGPHELRWAVHVARDGATAPDPYALVDDVFLPLDVVRAAGLGTAPERGSMLSVEGAEVSALRRRPGGLEVRVFNPTDEAATVRIEGRRGWLVDLRDRPLEPFEGSFELGPWAFATARLTDT